MWHPAAAFGGLPTATMSAATRTIETYELLEHMLLHLPTSDIILFRAVCSSWKSIIETSIHLRRATFRSPRTDSLLKPQLHMLFGNIFKPPSLKATHEDVDFLVNPLFSRPINKSINFPTYSNYPESPGKDGRGLVFFSLGPKRNLVRIETPFWRYTFLTQPPCTAICVNMRVNFRTVGASLYDKRGLPLGHVLDIRYKMERHDEPRWNHPNETIGSMALYVE